jgi:hypothetical protein
MSAVGRTVGVVRGHPPFVELFPRIDVFHEGAATEGRPYSSYPVAQCR